MRLIDADEFFKDFTELEPYEHISHEYDIDAVEVVRCKDCRYFKKYGFKLEYTECSHFDCDVSEDGYCAWGARMVNE